MFEIATGDIDAAGFAQVMSHHQPNWQPNMQWPVITDDWLSIRFH
jgi:hypothetical protein